MTSALPFDDFRLLIGNLPDGDRAQADRVRSAFATADALQGLGGIAGHAAWLAEWSGRPPAVRRPLVAIFAGNHGIARHLRPASDRRETAAMVERVAAGGAAVNQVCVTYDLGLKVFDLALDLPTADISVDAALDERDCAATMAFGMEAIAGGADLLCLSAFGAGNAVVAAAVLAALDGGGRADWLSPEREGGTQVDAALALHRAHLDDPLEVMRRLGGREFAAIAGAILAARMEKVPVILDGFAATAAAALLHAANPRALDHCRLASLSSPPHRRAAARLGLPALLDLDVADSGGVAGAIAAGLVKASAGVYSGVTASR